MSERVREREKKVREREKERWWDGERRQTGT